MSSQGRGDDPWVVMERRRSWMVSEASCRREGERTASKGCVFEGLCKHLQLLFVKMVGWRQGCHQGFWAL